MKNFLLSIVAILMLTAGSVTAQNINIGVKGGLNAFNIHTDNASNNDTKIGLHAGLLGHIHLKNQLALQPEIYYSMQGAKNGNTDINLGYINVPVLFQYMYNNGFRLQGGPQLGFLINAKADNNGSTNDIKDVFNSIDVGLSAGASYVNPGTSFGVDARYNLGLTDISESSSTKSTNRGFQVGVFYLFKHND